MKKKTLLLSALVLVVLALEGCATLRGIGEDIPHISLPRIPPNDFVKPAPVKRIFFCKLHSFAYGTRNIVFDQSSVKKWIASGKSMNWPTSLAYPGK